MKQGWSLKWALILVAIVLPAELGSFMPQAIGTSLTSVGEHFHTANLGWVSTLGLLFGGLFAPLIGKAADMYGKKRLILIMTALTVAGGVVSATAPNYGLFLLGRSLSSFIGPVVFLAYSLVRDVFPRRLLVVAISLTGTGIGVTTIVTPLLTGWLIDSFGYSGLYWFFGLYPLLAGLLFLAVVPESHAKVAARLGYVSAAWLGLGIGGVLVGISEGAGWGWTAGSTLACLAAGVACLGLWVAWDLRSSRPLVDIRLFGSRRVLTTAFAAALIYSAMTANALALPIMVMVPRLLGVDYGFGVSTLGVSTYLVPVGVATVIFGFVAGRLAPRIGVRLPFLLGALFIGAGLALTAGYHAYPWQLILFNCLIGVGEGLSLSAIPNLVVGAVPPEKQGAMASMVTVPQTIFTSVASQVYFVILGQHIGKVVGGSVIYTNRGFVIVFLLAAAISVASFCVGLAIPHGRPRHLQESHATEQPSLAETRIQF